MGAGGRCIAVAAVLAAVVLTIAAPAQGARIQPVDERSIIRDVPTPPVFPDAYEVEYNFILPYVQSVQTGGLRYPVRIWWDSPAQRFRMDVYGGMDSIIQVPGKAYNIYPRITTATCDMANTTVGPTLGLLGEGGSSKPLPDIGGWTFAGTAKVGNADALVWQLTEKHAEKVATYYFYTALNGWPLKLYMMGVNLITGSHFDEYLIEFTRFKPGPVNPTAFDPPVACKDAKQRQQQRQQQQPAAGRLLAAQLASLLPSAHVSSGSAAAERDALRAQAAAAYEANARFVDEFNAKAAAAEKAREQLQAAGAERAAAAPSFRLALNRFAHMTDEQFASTMLGLRRVSPAAAAATAGLLGDVTVAARVFGRAEGSSAAPSGGFLGTYQRVLSDNELPDSVDWRGTGADGPMKDQASCGSCWAFSAVGTMQGAWYQATGQSLSFSEQQLVDCSWDYGNNGCGGGEMEPAITYVHDVGGVVQEEAYQYLGQNSICRVVPGSGTDPLAGFKGPRGVFQGFMHVPKKDEGALMEAVHLHGPIAISMNAASLPFKFYSEGVYSNPECKKDKDHLDHAVLLMGYGTTADGVDYWIIKNSWSQYWGMGGYARITRKGNDCGITADPVMAMVDTEAAQQARAWLSAQRQRQE